MADDLNTAINLLTAHGYRITSPFEPRAFYSDGHPPEKLLKAAILDTETTGVNPVTDKIIELGIVVVEYCPESGQVYRVLETYDEFEDPCMPIPPASTKIHGITDDMVRNKTIIDSYVQNLIEDVSLVIAHNAAFDRGFVEKRFPFFQSKAWSCSFTQIPWKHEDISSSALEFLAYRFGFHFNGHRASIDCHALLEVLQSELPVSGVKAFKVLLNQVSSPPDIKLWAINTPFESKDKLKERGYRWHVERKTWYKMIPPETLENEREWLKIEIYNNRSFKLEQETIDAYNRFSIRSGTTEIVNY